MKKSRPSFKGKVMGASERKASQAFSYGYLKLPSGVPVFLPVPGKTVTLDFLPYEVTMKNHPDKYDEEGIAIQGEYWYRLPFKVHRNVGAKKDSVVCLQSFGKKCPICEYKIKRGKEGADKEELAAMRASDRYLYIVNPLDSDKFEAGKFHIFDISHAMFQKLLDDELKEESVPEDFMDPFEGVSLKVRFSSETIGNSRPFAEAKKITVVERKKQYKESVLDQIPKLDELLSILTYDELEKKFFELEDEVDDEDPHHTHSDRHGKSDVKSSKKQVPDEDEDEEDEKPVRKKKEVAPPSKKSVKKPGPEDEDEDEDELTWDDLMELSHTKLINLCSSRDLDADPDECDTEMELRIAMAKEMGIKISKQTPTSVSKSNACPACKGTGKDVKGKMCKVCMGTGVKQSDPEPEEDEEEEDEVPVQKRTPAKKEKEKSSEECPSGYTFGKDVDRHDECDSCELWDACMEAKKNKKK